MIKGVNLGGWFVLERWITPTLFTGVVGNDETVFVLQKPDAETHLKKHWSTWIKKEDFIWIKQSGLNLIRIPIPWWLFGDFKPYFGCVDYLDEAMKWAEELELDVMLDLHTAPGCQNGFDNGGIEGVLDWPKDPKNIDLTIDILERIAQRYKHNKALHSFQLLNEPLSSIDINIVKDFYKRAYKRVRKHLDKNVQIVFHDSFRINLWDDFFQESFENVSLDTHHYQCFDKAYRTFTFKDHINALVKKEKELIRLNHIVPLVVGEWSVSLAKEMYQLEKQESKEDMWKEFINTQLNIYNKLSGYIFWCYKTEAYYSGWNFKALYERGLIKREKL